MDIEKAIEYLKESVCIYKNTIPKISQAIETVLNELEYKQDDINVLQTQRDSVENQLKQAKAELEKKDKIIDEIIDEFYKKTKISTNCFMQRKRGIEQCLNYKNCKECIKQYFTRKVDKQKIEKVEDK